MSPAACRAEQVYALESVLPGFGGSFDASRAAACAQELARVACADAQTRPNSFGGVYPWSVSAPACAGLVSYGDAGVRVCVVGSGAPCDGVHTRCSLSFRCRAGRCEPRNVRGEQCRSTEDCQPSLGCLPAGDGGSACSEWLAQDAQCGSPGRSYDCVGALTCNGVCRGRGALGEACSTQIVGSCLGGLECVAGTCAAVLSEGAPCSRGCFASSCLASEPARDAGVCALLKPSTACHFLAGGQATCGSINSRAVTDGGAACVCEALFRRQNGEPCVRGDECAFPNLCESGHCVVPSNRPNGSSCRLIPPGSRVEFSSNSFCASGVCDETRTCVPAVPCP
jgi:hypothetical protein